MSTRNLISLLGVLVTSPLLAGTIVQQGSLSGTAGVPVVHDIVLEQFDSMGGTRELNFVQMDLLTSTIGGGTSNGSGIPTMISAELTADYFLDDELLAETQALINTTISNQTVSSFTVFNTDTEQVVIDQAPDLEPWIGRGQIMLTAETLFVLSEDPPGSVGFSAGGTVQYTVTYDFEVVSECPADFNLDGVVDAADLALLLGGWGPNPGAIVDLNGDDVVNAADLALLLGSWGACG